MQHAEYPLVVAQRGPHLPPEPLGDVGGLPSLAAVGSASVKWGASPSCSSRAGGRIVDILQRRIADQGRGCSRRNSAPSCCCPAVVAAVEQRRHVSRLPNPPVRGPLTRRVQYPRGRRLVARAARSRPSTACTSRRNAWSISFMPPISGTGQRSGPTSRSRPCRCSTRLSRR